MANSCAVKLSNTIVEKATINCTDTYMMLYANNSTIKEIDLTLSFIERSSEDIIEPIVNILDSSIITVSSANMSELLHYTQPLIYSDKHSKSYVGNLVGSVSIEANPAWTPSDDTMPIYGNNMSYNILEAPYVAISASFVVEQSGRQYEGDATVTITDMGKATSISILIEASVTDQDNWFIASDPEYTITTIAGDTVIYISVGEVGYYDIRCSLIDYDNTHTTELYLYNVSDFEPL